MIKKFSVSFEEELQKRLESREIQPHATGVLHATNLGPMLVYCYMCQGPKIEGWVLEPFSKSEKFEQIRSVIDQSDRIESIVSLREGARIRVDVSFFEKQGGFDKHLSMFVVYTLGGDVERFGVY